MVGAQPDCTMMGLASYSYNHYVSRSEVSHSAYFTLYILRFIRRYNNIIFPPLDHISLNIVC